MEKVNHIVITRKEEKELKKLNRLLEVMSIDLVGMVTRVETLEQENKSKSQEITDLVGMVTRVETLEQENKSKSQEITDLKAELVKAKKENEDFIRNQIAQISVNIQKSIAKEGAGTKPMFNFEGKKIDEHF